MSLPEFSNIIQSATESKLKKVAPSLPLSAPRSYPIISPVEDLYDSNSVNIEPEFKEDNLESYYK